MTAKKPVKNYRQLTEELELVISKFEDADIDIDLAIELHQSAGKIIAELETYLKTAKNHIEKAKPQKAK